MLIELKRSDLRELNSIMGMLNSPDTEANALGYEMLKTNEIIVKYFWDTWYCKNGKEIPVCWYFRKADQLKKEAEEGKTTESYWNLPKCVLRAIIDGDPVFKSSIRFGFNDD